MLWNTPRLRRAGALLAILGASLLVVALAARKHGKRQGLNKCPASNAQPDTNKCA